MNQNLTIGTNISSLSILSSFLIHEVLNKENSIVEYELLQQNFVNNILKEHRIATLELVI